VVGVCLIKRLGRRGYSPREIYDLYSTLCQHELFQKASLDKLVMWRLTTLQRPPIYLRLTLGWLRTYAMSILSI
jgi:hypothetical protein